VERAGAAATQEISRNVQQAAQGTQQVLVPHRRRAAVVPARLDPPRRRFLAAAQSLFRRQQTASSSRSASFLNTVRAGLINEARLVIEPGLCNGKAPFADHHPVSLAVDEAPLTDHSRPCRPASPS